MRNIQNLKAGKLLVEEQPAFKTSPFLELDVEIAIGATVGYSDGRAELADTDQYVLLAPVLTASDADIKAIAVESINIAATAVTLTSKKVVSITAAGHPFVTGDSVTCTTFVGSVELNDEAYTVTVVNENTITLDGTDGDDFTAYASGGLLTCTARSWIKTTLAAAATAKNTLTFPVWLNYPAGHELVTQNA